LAEEPSQQPLRQLRRSGTACRRTDRRPELQAAGGPVLIFPRAELAALVHGGTVGELDDVAGARIA